MSINSVPEGSSEALRLILSTHTFFVGAGTQREVDSKHDQTFPLELNGFLLELIGGQKCQTTELS